MKKANDLISSMSKARVEDDDSALNSQLQHQLDADNSENEEMTQREE